MCRYLACHSALTGYDKDWLGHYEDNIAVKDIGSWHYQPDLSEKQQCKVTMRPLEVYTHPDMTLDGARM